MVAAAPHEGRIQGACTGGHARGESVHGGPYNRLVAAAAGQQPTPDRFTLPPAGATPLAAAMAERIRAEGPITFAAFMDAALYDETQGYYRRGGATVGREGDYLTSPEVHPLFGYVIGALAAELWDQLGRPTPWIVREVGPGSGACMESLCAWIRSQRPDVWEALRCELIEPAPLQEERQRRQLGALGERASWSAEGTTPMRGLLFANELLDAQPVHRLRYDGARWQELYVGVDGAGRFEDVAGEPSEAGLLEPLGGLTPAEGQVVEVSPAVPELVDRLGRAVEAGLLLLFDYGYPRAQLYAPWRRSGTLMTYHRHAPGEDPYVRVGEQDLTCHVDIDAVQATAVATGMRALPARSQAALLAEIGATQMPAAASGGRGAELDGYLARRRAVEVLSDPGGLGRIRALAFARGFAGTLRGLS